MLRLLWHWRKRQQRQWLQRDEGGEQDYAAVDEDGSPRLHYYCWEC